MAAKKLTYQEWQTKERERKAAELAKALKEPKELWLVESHVWNDNPPTVQKCEIVTRTRTAVIINHRFRRGEKISRTRIDKLDGCYFTTAARAETEVLRRIVTRYKQARTTLASAEASMRKNKENMKNKEALAKKAMADATKPNLVS